MFLLFTVSAGEGEGLGPGLLLPAHALGEPVQVDGVDLVLELDEDAGVVSEQVPAENVMVVAAGVQLISAGPSHAAHQLSVCSGVKGQQTNTSSLNSAADSLPGRSISC